jgi:glycosyltransferase involved in cell wall biosynthesis
MLPVIFRGKSLVALTDDVYYEARSDKLPFRYRFAYRIFSTWAAKHATKLMTFSESSRRAVSRLFKIPIEKIYSNYHGVDISSFPAISHKLPAVSYGLYVGQAFPRRHLKETLLAFEKISPRFPELDFIAVGKDKYQPPFIFNLVKDINNHLGREAIRYETYVSEEELLNLYRNAKFVAYVSDQEAFGLPPIEALGHGSMPVVADVEITREIFGNNAFFVQNPISVETIADTMSRVLTDEAKRNDIRFAAKNIVAKLTWSKHAENFLEIIKITACL